MKQKILLFAIVLMSFNFVACVDTANGKTSRDMWLRPDSTISQQLGASLTNVLFSPKKVTCYHLIRKKDITDKDVQPIKGYVRDSLLTVFTDKQTAVLQYLLLTNNKSYSEDIISIEAPYVPVIEFEFADKKKRVASVIISLSDRSWTIMYDEKEQFNYNYADARLLDRFCNLFLEGYYNAKNINK